MEDHENSCDTQKKQDSCHSSGCEMTDKLMHLAEKAWEKLLIEKMKKILEEKNGARMDKVAQATVEATNSYWEHKMKGKTQCHDAKDKIKSAFMG